MPKKQEEKYKIIDIVPDQEEDGDIGFAQLVIETDDGFVIHCDSDFPDEPLGYLKKEELLGYKSKLVKGNLVFLPYLDTIKQHDKKERNFKQKEGTYETEVIGEVVVSEVREGMIHFDVDCGKFTFSIETKKTDLNPKVGDSIYAKGDLRIEDIEIKN